MFWTFSHKAYIQPRSWSPAEARLHRTRRLALEGRCITSSSMHQQLKHAVNRLRQQETDPVRKELLEYAWAVRNDYTHLREAVTRYKDTSR